MAPASVYTSNTWKGIGSRTNGKSVGGSFPGPGKLHGSTWVIVRVEDEIHVEM